MTVLIALIINAFPALIGALAVALITQTLGLHGPVWLGIATGLRTVGIIASLWLYLAWIEKKPWASIGLDTLWPGWLWAGLLVALSTAMACHSLGLISLKASYLAGFGGLSLLLGRAVQGSAEELVARGWLYQRIRAVHGPDTAVWISSAFFVLLHAANSHFGWPAIFLLVTYSLLACKLVDRYGLAPVMGFHAAWNWIMYGLEVYQPNNFWLIQIWILGALYFVDEKNLPDALVGRFSTQ